MYNPGQKQYILKNSLGISYHVYFEQGRGLCIRMLSDSRIWSRGYVLDKTAINDFSVVLDKNDIFHFFYQIRDGSLMYGHGMHGQIESWPVLNSKDPTPWSKHVSLLVSEDTTIFFYIIRYQNRNLISMQTIREGKLSRPVAVDYIEGTRYSSFLDRKGKCHLFYASPDKSKTNLYHRICKDDFSTFNLPEKIYTTDHKINFLSAICTETNDIHIAFEVAGDEFCEIMYKNLTAEGRPEVLYQGKTDPGCPGLVYINGSIFCFRAADENIYFRSSENNGESWSDEVLYPLGNNVCFSYVSNFPKDGTVFSTEIPGNFTRGYQLAFFNEVKIKPPDKKTSNSQENASFSNLEKKILLLQNLTDNMQRELTKLWITQKSFEKKLDYLIRSYSGLQEQIMNQSDDEYNEEPPSEPADDTSDSIQTGEFSSEKV